MEAKNLEDLNENPITETKIWILQVQNKADDEGDFFAVGNEDNKLLPFKKSVIGNEEKEDIIIIFEQTFTSPKENYISPEYSIKALRTRDNAT